MDASIVPQAVEVWRRRLLFLDSASLDDARAAEDHGFVGGITAIVEFSSASQSSEAR
jgi:hypothetical protein